LPNLKPISNLFILLFFIASLSGCEHKNETETERTIIAFGTLIEITLYGVDNKKANAALDKLEADFERYHAAWTPWQNSALRRTNNLIKTGGTFSVAPSILPLIKQSIDLANKSNNLFNPAIGNLINLWEFHKHEDPDIHPPSSKAIAELVAKNPSMSDLRLDKIKLSSRNPSVQLNFGAFAKGYAIDRSMEHLHAEGIHNAIINTGGDLSVSGRHGDRAWSIGIRHPRKETTIAWLEAADHESIFTSGDYERYYMYENKRYHHILDPRTGYPAKDSSSVTVVHNNAAEADAAATALFVAGPENWYKLAKALGIRYVMLIDTEGTIHMNPAMAKRIQFTNDATPSILLSQPL